MTFLPPLLLALTASAPDDSFFESQVRPVLVEQCVKCHGPDKASGGLRLDSRAAILKGGESGQAAVAGKTKESRLIQAVRRQKDVSAMPPDKPLDSRAVAALEKWVSDGLPWPESAAPVKTARHWAFEPVRDVKVQPGVVNPIDAFLQAKWREQGVTPTRPADKRTLIRRATFDLTGLPPTPEEVDRFLADPSADAYAKLLDRLLQSPRYGEKWGRHWLDVVRYADTAGETADFPVPDAWRYRNYVIDAFNKDTPYNQFLREQFAGDILAQQLPKESPAGRYAELVTATGYLAVARRFGFDVQADHFLTLEDTIDTMGKSVLGLTVGCARCHDHKYDPISIQDYYALYGIFESTRFPHPGCEKEKAPRDNVALMSKWERESRLRPLQERLAVIKKERSATEAQLKNWKSEELAKGGIPNGGKQEFAGNRLKAVRVQTGDMIRLSIGPKANQGADSTLVEWELREAGENGRVWNVTKDLIGDFHQGGQGFQHADSFGNQAVWHLLDVGSAPGHLLDFEKDSEKTPGLHFWRFASAYTGACAFVNTNDKTIKFSTVTQPARSLGLHPGPASAAAIAWQSPIDGVVEIRGRIADMDAGGGDGVDWSIAIGRGIDKELAAERATRKTLLEAERAVADFDRSIVRAYAVWEGSPHDAQLQKRGDPMARGEAVPRRFLTVLGGQKLPPNAGSGRLALADWLADPKNPLTARVMVNRIWQGHFGLGIVETPNDFGTRGAPPTHPELLDWLAAEFVRTGWSIKAMHRRIMLSEAYQRSSASEAGVTKPDAFRRRRLTAEEIRDSLLAVSGDLDVTPGGPHPFPEPKTWGFSQHGPFKAVYETNRRSVYLMTQRIQRHPFLTLFDGADTNASTASRQTTTVPTQALFFLNDPFVHARAESLAKKLASLPADQARLNRACRLLYGRAATEAERDVSASFLASGGTWSDWLRVMFGSNEFIYVD